MLMLRGSIGLRVVFSPSALYQRAGAPRGYRHPLRAL